MKILVVGDYKFETMALYLERNLCKIGHTVDIFCYRSTFRKVNADNILSKGLRHVPLLSFIYTNKMNKDLLELSKKNYDLVIVLKGETLFPSTIRSIRKSGAIIVNWLMDPITSLDRGFLFDSIPEYNYFFVKDRFMVRRLNQIGFDNVRFLLECYDSDIYHPVKLNSNQIEKYSCDVGFVGNIYPYRLKILKCLTKYNLKVWGNIVANIKTKEYKSFYQGNSAFSDEKNLIFNSAKIVLNTHNPWEVESTNVRIFEICGSGTMQITDTTLLTNTLFSQGSEIVVYKNIHELSKQVGYYLSRKTEREKIGRAGLKKAIEYHTYPVRINELFRFIGA